jgi:hypothetical protein
MKRSLGMVLTFALAGGGLACLTAIGPRALWAQGNPLSAEVWHTWEHYGNVVVYLRMKGLVPPSSERMQMK